MARLQNTCLLLTVLALRCAGSEGSEENTDAVCALQSLRRAGSKDASYLLAQEINRLPESAQKELAKNISALQQNDLALSQLSVQANVLLESIRKVDFQQFDQQLAALTAHLSYCGGSSFSGLEATHGIEVAQNSTDINDVHEKLQSVRDNYIVPASDLFSCIADANLESFSAELNKVIEQVNSVFGGISWLLKKLRMIKYLKVVSKAFNLLTAPFDPAETFVQVLDAKLQGIGKKAQIAVKATDTVDNIVEKMQNIAYNIQTKFPQSLQDFVGYVAQVTPDVQRALNYVKDQKDKAQRALNNIKNWLENTFGGMKRFFENAMEHWGKHVAKFLQTISDVYDGLKEVPILGNVLTFIEKASNTFDDLVDQVLDDLGITKLLGQFIDAMMPGIRNAVQAMLAKNEDIAVLISVAKAFAPWSPGHILMDKAYTSLKQLLEFYVRETSEDIAEAGTRHVQDAASTQVNNAWTSWVQNSNSWRRRRPRPSIPTRDFPTQLFNDLFDEEDPLFDIDLSQASGYNTDQQIAFIKRHIPKLANLNPPGHVEEYQIPIPHFEMADGINSLWSKKAQLEAFQDKVEHFKDTPSISLFIREDIRRKGGATLDSSNHFFFSLHHATAVKPKVKTEVGEGYHGRISGISCRKKKRTWDWVHGTTYRCRTFAYMPLMDISKPLAFWLELDKRTDLLDDALNPAYAACANAGGQWDSCIQKTMGKHLKNKYNCNVFIYVIWYGALGFGEFQGSYLDFRPFPDGKGRFIKRESNFHKDYKVTFYLW